MSTATSPQGVGKRRVLVVGSTGKQGKEVVKNLLKSRDLLKSGVEVLCLTREGPGGAKEKALKALDVDGQGARVTAIQGDLDKSDEEIQRVVGECGGKDSIYGVFLMTEPAFGKKDAKTGKSLEVVRAEKVIDACVAAGVRRLVLSSVDRGGEEKSPGNPTEIPHFLTKHRVEEYLIEKAGSVGMTWTILRPVAFMENLTPNGFGRIFAAMWSQLGDKRLQLVTTKDIGVFGAQSLAANADDENYRNKAISLAGDELTQQEANEIFWKVLGRPMPRAYGFMASALQWAVKEVGAMFTWFRDEGYGADIEKCRGLNPEMRGFEAWLREESGFKR